MDKIGAGISVIKTEASCDPAPSPDDLQIKVSSEIKTEIKCDSDPSPVALQKKGASWKDVALSELTIVEKCEMVERILCSEASSILISR